MTIPHAGGAGHTAGSTASAWVARWACRIAPGSAVLDVACGGGRHARWFAARGHPVDAVDRDRQAIAELGDVAGVTARCADIESGLWPYAGRSYGAVVVTNYLHRPLFPHLLAAVAPGGLLIYETFAAGNERFGRPVNPDFLLRPGELRELVAGRLDVLDFEEGVVREPRPAMIQRICAARPAR